MDHEKVWNRGVEDYWQGHEQGDNPYDVSAYPEEHAAWQHVWRTAQGRLEQPLIPSDDRHVVMVRKECPKS